MHKHKAKTKTKTKQKKGTVEGGRGGGLTLTDFDLDELRSGDQADARRALYPHLAVGVKTGDPRAAFASAEERAKGVCVSLRVACPVLDAGVYDVEFEGEDVLEDMRAR